jgi:WD40 repeat protein
VPHRTLGALLASAILAACQGPEGASPQVGEPSSCLSELAGYDGPRDYTYSVSWSPIDDHVLAGTNVELRLFAVDVESPDLQLVATLEERARAAVVAWHPDGRHALSAGTEVKLLAIERDPPAIVQLDAFAGHQGHVYGLRWSPAGAHALTGGEDGTVRLLAVDAAAGTLTQRAILFGHFGKVLGVAWSPDGRHALSVGEDASVRLLAVDVDADPPELRELAMERDRNFDLESAVSWPARGYPVVTGTWGRHKVKLWSVDTDAATMDLETEFPDRHSSGLDILEWTDDEEWIVTGGHDDTIRLSRFADGTFATIATLEDHQTGAHSVSWAPDDLHLVLASSMVDRISLVDVSTCEDPPLLP